MELYNNKLSVDPILQEKEATTLAERVGERIRTIRIEAGLSLSELGNKVGLNADRMQKYENGQRKPKQALLQKIADALHVSIDALEDPIIETHIGAIYALFIMEEMYGLEITHTDGKPCITFKDSIINDLIDEWDAARQYKKTELLLAESEEDRAATEKEYLGWIWNFPEAIVLRSNAEMVARLKATLNQLEQDNPDET